MPLRELLLDIGTVGMKDGLAFEVVPADFGGGWYAAAVLDAVPMRRWSLTWSGVYHDLYERPALIQPRYQDGSTLEDLQSRPKYLRRFFARRMMEGCTPFYMPDPFEIGNPLTPTYQLVRFDVMTLDMQQSEEKNRWSYSVNVTMARVPGVPTTIVPPPF